MDSSSSSIDGKIGAKADGASSGAAVSDTTRPTPSLAKRLAPIAILIIAASAIVALDLHTYFSFEALKTHRQVLVDFVTRHAPVAALTYVAIYAVSTAMSLPGGAILSIAGGFLFGSWLGGTYVVIGATIGATAVFLIARSAFGDALRSRAGPWLRKMEAGFQRDALNYLLVLRLIPLFPFFVVNLVPAFLGVKLRTYIIATAVGIIPGSFVFAFAGAGIGSVLDSSESFSPGVALTGEVLAALVGLAVLALVPVVYRTVKRSGEEALDANTGGD